MAVPSTRPHPGPRTSHPTEMRCRRFSFCFAPCFFAVEITDRLRNLMNLLELFCPGPEPQSHRGRSDWRQAKMNAFMVEPFSLGNGVSDLTTRAEQITKKVSGKSVNWVSVGPPLGPFAPKAGSDESPSRVGPRSCGRSAARSWGRRRGRRRGMGETPFDATAVGVTIPRRTADDTGRTEPLVASQGVFAPEERRNVATGETRGRRHAGYPPEGRRILSPFQG